MNFSEFIMANGSTAEGLARIPVFFFGMVIWHKTFHCLLTGYLPETECVQVKNTDTSSKFYGVISVIHYTHFYTEADETR